MNPRKISTAKFGLLVALSAGLLVLATCGGGASSSTTSTTPVNNTQSVQVDLGPANNSVNMLFVDVEVCVPGSSTCQTIQNVQVDTGSVGLHLLSSAVGLSLPAITDTSGNALQECISFADGSYVWGPVETADIQMAGEKATSVPLQVISASPTFSVPSTCTSGGGPNLNTVAALGANGILGVGVFQQDCGVACTTTSPPAVYYLCPNSVCQVNPVPLADELQNPVYLFPQDNNGVLITLPSVAATGAPTFSGSLIFGVGTQSNNGLGSAQIYATDANGNFQTTYNGIAYSQSFIDTGSNGLYFLDHAKLGITECSDNRGYYCPGSTVNYTVTNTGLNGTTAPVSFSIANADTLFATPNSAFNDLGGDSGTSVATDYFDFGLPFFYGRDVFIGIEGKAAPTGVVGPYWAY